MINKEVLKKQIIYRSNHRGSKEMDLLLGSFVKKNLDNFSVSELNDLRALLDIEDVILEKWYFKNAKNIKIPHNNVSNKLKNFQIK